MKFFYKFLRCALLLAAIITIPSIIYGALPDTTTVNGTHLYKLNLAISTSGYQSAYYITPSSPKVSIKDNSGANELWYILETNDTPTGTFERDHIDHYCYIVNAVSGQYLYYTGTNSNSIVTDAVEMKDINAAGLDNDRFKFIIKKSGNSATYNCCMYPKIAAENNKFSGNTNLWESNSSGYLSLGVPHGSTYTNGLTLSKERNGEWSSQWVFVYSSLLAAPTITFNNETNSFSISHSTLTSGCTIYYTLDGSTPSTTSNAYSEPVFVETTETVKAVVIRDNDNILLTEVGSLEVEPVDIVAPTVTNTYDGYISLSTTTPGATIYYTTNGDTPDDNSTEYEDEPFALGDATVIKAIAYIGSDYSDVTTYNVPKYTTPTVSFDNSTSKVTITCTGATGIYYTTDGSTPTTSSTSYSEPFTVTSTTTVKAIATHAGYLTSDVAELPIIFQCATPVITKTSVTTFTIECSYPTSGVTIYYNTGDGSQEDPTDESTEYPGEVTFDENDLPFTVKAIAYADDYDHSTVATLTIEAIHDYSKDYLTFNVLTDGTICWKAFGTGYERTIEYSINNGSWTSIASTSAGATFDVNKNDVVRFRGNNTSYAGSNSNYSGFEGGTATFDIDGNIHSLLYGDDFLDNNSLTNSTYQFCSLFKKSLVISAENLILPATTLKNYCYRAIFSWCTTLEKAPVLPATTLAKGCYWYMFEKCAITSAPELNATTLVTDCYGHMFEGCASLNYVKCMATSISATNCKADWLKNVSSTGTFVKESNTTWPSGASGIPLNWTQYNEFLLYSPEISCDGEFITITCATEGASIFYRLNQTGNFSLYTEPISVNTNTTVEAYSTKGNNTSNTVIISFEIYDNPFDESNRSIDSWTYGGNQVTLPYSVNAIDGHSSNYAKGTFNFETTITLYKEQPTYLWFQHADQSATIYVDNNLVEKHWGGYNAFFVDISNHVHKGTNHIKVALKNNEGNVLAPYAGDFNFNATLGNVKLFTSPYMPSMSYGYDGFHITSTVSSAEATINVKTTIPTGATVVCTISGDNCNYTETKSSTGNELVFTTTITNPRLWNGTIDPYLYNVKVEIYHDNELYHRYERPYGLRFYEYVFNRTVNGNSYTGFLLNGQPYLLRGVCVHDDLVNKANALNDTDYTQEFDIITELGCNFLRLAHYPHPKEVYDKCDQLGIIVQTEAPWVNRSSITETEAYWTHLEGQCADMVNQHYNHPCIVFWGVGNEINTTYTNTTEGKDFVKDKIEGYRDTIRSLMPNAWVGYTVSHGTQNGLGVFNNPTVDWIGQNIYVGWYVDKTSNNPTQRLTTAINNATTQNTPCAYSEYGCGGTPSCHSDDFKSTTTTGNNPRHDIEYQMWLHEGHIAAIKNKPELLFTSQWQLFDIAVWNRTEGYKVCKDGEESSVFDNDELKRLNNKGLVERDHKTKKDTYYLYKAWWNQTDKFVHICGKDYKKTTGRVIKCYTNDGSTLKLYVNDEEIETATVTNNIATFTERTFTPGDVIRVAGDNSDDTFTIANYNVFTTEGNWNEASNWSADVVPAAGCDVDILANATVPSGCTANTGNVSLYGNTTTLTIADGGQLVSNSAVNATVQKNITAYTISQNQGELLTNGWYFIASPITDDYTPAGSMIANTYDLYRLNNTTWENFKNTTAHPDFTTLNNGTGYLYANSGDVTLQFTGALKPYAASESVSVSTGWNLIGNPFAYNVYSNRSFYKMNEEKNGVEAVSAYSTNPIAPCTGIVVKAESDGDVIISKEAPEQSQGNNGSLQIALSQPATEPVERDGVSTNSTTFIDNAIVSFNNGDHLDKFYFGAQNANIYIPQGSEEYAIVSANAKGEMTINFKAHENGIYTLTVNSENAKMSYLHLIDNITDTDVDLLQTPEYTFNAMTTDYESRFKLLFVRGDVNDDNETFAYINNGNIIITADVEDATLQVIDVMGRVILCKDARPCVSTNRMAPGTYILRLINSEKAMTQKIVIR